METKLAKQATQVALLLKGEVELFSLVAMERTGDESEVVSRIVSHEESDVQGAMLALLLSSPVPTEGLTVGAMDALEALRRGGNGRELFFVYRLRGKWYNCSRAVEDEDLTFKQNVALDAFWGQWRYRHSKKGQRK